MSKTNKELVTDLTIAFMQSWNSKTNTVALKADDVSHIFNMFKKLIEGMDESTK